MKGPRRIRIGYANYEEFQIITLTKSFKNYEHLPVSLPQGIKMVKARLVKWNRSGSKISSFLSNSYTLIDVNHNQ